MREPQPRTEIAGVEGIVVVAIGLASGVAPWPEVVPVALPLLVAGTVSRWVRRRTWSEVVFPRRDFAASGDAFGGPAWHAGVGALAGLAALVVAAFVASQGMSALSGRAVEWSEHAIVRGNVQLVLIVGLYVAITAVAAELALRGWIVERVLELSPGSPVLPVATGALAELVVTPGDLGTRLGAAVFGAGLGWIYVATTDHRTGRRSVVAPIAARIAFQSGAVVLEALRVVG